MDNKKVDNNIEKTEAYKKCKEVRDAFHDINVEMTGDEILSQVLILSKDVGELIRAKLFGDFECVDNELSDLYILIRSLMISRGLTEKEAVRRGHKRCLDRALLFKKFGREEFDIKVKRGEIQKY
jgi:hypothetical protein